MRADFATRRPGRRPRVAEIAMLGLAGALLVYAGYSAWATTRQLKHARASLLELRESAQRRDGRLREGESARRGRDEELGSMAAQTLAAPPPRLLADLQPTIPAGARLEALTLDYGGEAVQLEMQLISRTPEIYDQFLARIEGSGRFSDLSFGTENRSGEMKVTVRASYRIGEPR